MQWQWAVTQRQPVVLTSTSITGVFVLCCWHCSVNAANKPTLTYCKFLCIFTILHYEAFLPTAKLCCLSLLRQPRHCLWTQKLAVIIPVADWIGNESVPIQLAQCWFPGLAISNDKIQIDFSNEIHGSNFIKQHLETVMVWNHQNADCSLRKKFYSAICYNFAAHLRSLRW